MQLKERTKQRFLDLADLVPQMNPGGSGRVMAPEFRNVLNKLGFFMDDAEFEKLWKRYIFGCCLYKMQVDEDNTRYR